MKKDLLFNINNSNSWIDLYKKDPDLFNKYPDLLDIVLEKPNPNEEEQRLIGKIAAQIFFQQGGNTTYELTGIFRINKELLDQENILIGLIEEYPNLFLILEPEYIEKYYDKLKQIFIKNINKFNANINESCDNTKAGSDPEVIDLLLKIDKDFTLTFINLRKLYHHNKDYLLNLYKKYNLTIRNYDYDLIKQDSDFQLISYSNDPYSIKYFKNIRESSLVINILETENTDLYSIISIYSLKNEIVKKYIINKYNLNQESQLLLDRILDSLDKGIDPNNMELLVKDYAINDYENFKLENRNLANLRSYILNLLEACRNYQEFITNFEFYNQFKEIFDDEFNNLVNTYFINNKNKNTLNEIFEMIHKFTYMYKEFYIKKTYENFINQISNNLYKTNINSETVRKRLKEKLQKKIFIGKYRIDDSEVLKAISDALIKTKSRLKVDYPLDNDEIYLIIKKYILEEKKLIEPNRYQDILKQKELSKLINRLNAGNIDENNIDYIKNKEYLKYKIINNKKVYYTDYFNFTKEELLECSKFVAYQTVIKIFNGNIMPYIKKIEVDVDYDEIVRLNIDFNKENYLFNPEQLLNINIEDFENILNQLNNITKLNDNSKNKLLDLLFNQDLLLLILKASYLPMKHSKKMIDYPSFISEKDHLSVLEKIIKNIDRLPLLINMDDFRIENFSKIQTYISILEGLSNEDIELLGSNIINLTTSSTSFNPTNKSVEERLKRTSDLYKKMQTKTHFTVPRIEGEYNGIKYEVMKQDDPHFLTCGFETDACFRVCGNDNNFLHYCALNKNGFVIKISDNNGNFLGRASGFRNGNAIYLNQIRTIFDRSGNHTKHIPKSFIKDIIIALKACTDDIIIETLNTDEPIDFAIINRAYILEQFDRNIFDITIDDHFDSFLRKTPVNANTDDWREFLKEKGLIFEEYMNKNKSTPNDILVTDYPGYIKVVLSVSDPRKKVITRTDFYSYDPEPIYRIDKTFSK